MNSIFVYGPAHAGKTTLAASFETPILHLMWDVPGKELPLTRKGLVARSADPNGMPVVDVYSAQTAQLLSRTECWQQMPGVHDENGVWLFIDRLKALDAQWNTLVLDSTSALASALEWHSRNFAKNEKGKPVADNRQHYGFVGSVMKMIFYNILPMWPAKNKIVISHIRAASAENSRAEGIAGDMLRIPDLPGQLKGNFSGAFTEVWRAYADREGVRRLQTVSDGTYLAHTSIGVPTGIPNDWPTILANLPK